MAVHEKAVFSVGSSYYCSQQSFQCSRGRGEAFLFSSGGKRELGPGLQVGQSS